MKYNKQTIDKLLNALKEHRGRVNACRIANITYETFCQWMKNPEFSEQISIVENENDEDMCNKAVLCIYKNMEHDWRAAGWLLERHKPEKYVKKEINTNININADITDKTENEIHELFKKLNEGDK